MTKALLPTLRERKRYLAFEVLAEKEIPWDAIKKAVALAVKEYIGLEGTAKAGVLFVKNNKNKGILRVSHLYLGAVRAALLFIQEIQQQQVTVRSIIASGSLTKVCKYI